MADNINILLIDDDQKIINALKRILNKNEYILFSAAESEQALSIINNYKIDIIICDYSMPTMSGIEILKYSKTVLPDAIRILITGYSDLNVTISFINEIGIYYYIKKPWVNQEVISAVEKAAQLIIMQDNKYKLFEINNNSKKTSTNEDDFLAETKANTEASYKKQGTNKRFTVYEDEDIILINSSEIYYLTALNGNVFVITEKGKYISPDSLNSWEKKLDESKFFRSHRGYIVNIDKIDKISPWFNGSFNLKFRKINESVPVSRNNMKKLKFLLEI